MLNPAHVILDKQGAHPTPASFAARGVPINDTRPPALDAVRHQAVIITVFTDLSTAASLGAAISMGLLEALSDDGEATGRGSPLQRGAITGIATGVGGMLHTLPFLSPNLDVALNLAYAVVACELIGIAFIRYRFMAVGWPAQSFRS